MQVKKPQKNQNTKNKSVIVDQQNEPFLKTIFKRVRNINKKLTEIADLKKKEDLKPEQIEKINRKAEYEQQKAKLENIADFFRQVYAQNQQHYKNNQLQELDALAQAIAVIRGNVQFKQSESLNDLKKVLTQPSTQSVAESVKQTTEVLRKFASDYKLKKVLTTLVEQSSQVKSSEVKIEQPITCEQFPEVPQVEQKKVQVQPAKEKPTPVVQQPVVASEPQQKVEQQVQQSQPATSGQQVQKPAEEGRKPRGDRPYKPRNNNNRNYQTRDGKPRGDNEQRQGGERRRYQHNGERKQRPNYRPKQDDTEKQQNKQHQDSDSSLEKDPEIRKFRRDQIKKLQNDGFIVIQKNKPQQTHQKKWHENNNGRRNQQPRAQTAQ